MDATEHFIYGGANKFFGRKKASIKSFKLLAKPSLVLSVEGNSSNDIRIQKVQFVNDVSLISLGNGVDKNAVQIVR